MPSTGFTPSVHGFHFSNRFTNYLIPLPLAPIPIPFNGLCGGMALAAQRYFQHNIPIPTQTECDYDGVIVWPLPPGGTRLRQYIISCQHDSYGPLSGLSALNWITAASWDTQFDWSLNEFAAVKRHIDTTGQPTVLGLRRRAADPFGHQVLAIGYDENPRRVYVYDPNFPNTNCEISLDERRRRLIGPGNGNLQNDDWWSSFFITGAIQRSEPPTYVDLGLQEGIIVRPEQTPARVGRRLDVEVAVRNFGDFPAIFQQVCLEVRDPQGRMREDMLTQDRLAGPLPAGQERRFRATSARFGDIPGTYTIRVTYLSEQGQRIPVPGAAGGTRPTVTVDLLPESPPAPIGNWASLGGILKSAPSVGQNQDGRLQVFGRGADDRIWQLYQQTVNVPNAYSGWELLPGDQTFRGPVSVVLNNWNKLELFARGRDNQIWHRWQNDPNVREAGRWSGWSSLGSAGGGMTTDPTACLNWDKRIEVFSIGADNQLYHNWQRWFDAFGAPWSGWYSLPGRLLKGRVAAETDAGGCMHVIGRALDDSLWVNFQTARGGEWSGWLSFGGIASGDPVLSKNSDGRLEVFIRGGDSRIWHKWQTAPNGNWSNWQPLNESSNPQAYLIGEGRVSWIRSRSGALELYARLGSSEAVTIRQTPALPYWTNFQRVGSRLTSDPAVGLHPSGTVQVFGLGDGQDLIHTWFSR